MEASQIWKTVLGQDHQDYALSLIGLAHIYQAQGKYSQAETLYRQALTIQEKAVGRASPDYNRFLRDLALLYQVSGRFSESAAAFLETAGYDRTLLSKEASYSSENQMLAYLPIFNGSMAQYLSFVQVHPSPALLGAGLDNALLMNGLLLENARYLTRSVSTADSVTRETYNNWQAAHRRLAREYAKPVSERRHVSDIEAEAERYEKTLLRRLPAFNETRRLLHCQDVRDQLHTGEVALEFVHYRYYTPKATDSMMYAVFVLRPGDAQPQLIPLFEERELTPLLHGATGGSNFIKINTLYASKTASSKAKSLYELIWQPLESQLRGVTTVYCSLTGLLYRLNLAAIPTRNGSVFGDQYQVVLIGSTRALVIPNSKRQNTINNAYLAGGIRYDSDSTVTAYANRGTVSRSFELTGAPIFQPDSTSITRGSVLDYLPATASEVRSIGQMLKTANMTVKIDTGFYATEEAFLHLGRNSSSPRIIHLATHGYFFPDPKEKRKKSNSAFGQEPVFKMSEHPMIRSGLLLAGAKEAWFTGQHPASQEDGILTAYEISQMNLSGTELVVLSACETGLGDIVGNEGVYGLQRAFKIAGAKYLIMSLWKVDDRSTQEFMTAFYKHWLTNRQSVPQAFRTAQREMREKHSSAYDWAGFVLIE